jgi:hypothetical protein
LCLVFNIFFDNDLEFLDAYSTRVGATSASGFNFDPATVKFGIKNLPLGIDYFEVIVPRQPSYPIPVHSAYYHYSPSMTLKYSIYRHTFTRLKLSLPVYDKLTLPKGMVFMVPDHWLGFANSNRVLDPPFLVTLRFCMTYAQEIDTLYIRDADFDLWVDEL